VGPGWAESLLIGAILAPTDPAFASALVGNDKVPARLRHLLNVESGVNYGLALPFVIVFLVVAAGSDDLHLGELAVEVTLGLAIGVVIPVAVILLERSRFFSASPAYEPLNGLAIGLLVLAVSQAAHANLFLAAFAAGITIATFGPRQRAAFEHFGENVAELFKLAALLVFGALISPALLGEISWAGWVFAVLAIFVAGPVALWLSFLRSGLGLREQAAAMWFGPKGFASVVYGLLVLEQASARPTRPSIWSPSRSCCRSCCTRRPMCWSRAFDDQADVPGGYGVVRRKVRATRSDSGRVRPVPTGQDDV
jgi:NhaP-type Na+/H+ or K+/H+ antiporter